MEVTDTARAIDPVEATYVRACVAALNARRDCDQPVFEVFYAVAHAIEAAWPEAVKSARGRGDASHRPLASREL